MTLRTPSEEEWIACRKPTQSERSSTGLHVAPPSAVATTPTRGRHIIPDRLSMNSDHCTSSGGPNVDRCPSRSSHQKPSVERTYTRSGAVPTVSISLAAPSSVPEQQPPQDQETWQAPAPAANVDVILSHATLVKHHKDRADAAESALSEARADVEKAKALASDLGTETERLFAERDEARAALSEAREVVRDCRDAMLTAMTAVEVGEDDPDPQPCLCEACRQRFKVADGAARSWLARLDAQGVKP